MLEFDNAFYTRRGQVVVPGAGATVKPRRGVFGFVVADGHFIVVEPHWTHGVVELPGGGIESGETLDEAMAREWAEEVGIPFAAQGPKREFHHRRGFYAENLNEFWIYDQTFRLYDYTLPPEPGQCWTNSEGEKVSWQPLAALPALPLHSAHRAGLNALMMKD